MIRHSEVFAEAKSIAQIIDSFRSRNLLTEIPEDTYREFKVKNLRKLTIWFEALLQEINENEKLLEDKMTIRTLLSVIFALDELRNFDATVLSPNRCQPPISYGTLHTMCYIANNYPLVYKKLFNKFFIEQLEELNKLTTKAKL